MFQIKKIALQFQNVFFMVQLPLSFCSILNYTEADGDLNMLPLLKRIIQNKIPLWIFRLVFFTLYKIIYYIYIYNKERKQRNNFYCLHFNCSGDQDSVVPLLGSRTLVRELAHDLRFQITAPYGAWYHKGQVFLEHLQIFFCPLISAVQEIWDCFVCRWEVGLLNMEEC